MSSALDDLTVNAVAVMQQYIKYILPITGECLNINCIRIN